MSTYLIQDSTLSDIADAIRAKDGISGSMTASEMASRITDMQTLGDTNVIFPWRYYLHADLTSFSSDATCVGDNAFNQCAYLSQLSLPKVVHIGYRAFSSCRSLTGIDFPNLIFINPQAFYSCNHMSYVILPNVGYIGDSAFYNCYSLSDLNLPKVNAIGGYAFTYCSNLKTVNMPKASYIGSYAFSACSSLHTVSLSDVTWISTAAFSNARKLSSLYLMGSSIPYIMASDVFYSTPIGGYSSSNNYKYGSIYVPESLYSSYRKASVWSLLSPRFVSV